MSSHDHAYKMLFSHPHMVRDLIVGFVQGKWHTPLESLSLEKCNAHFVTDHLRKRDGDIIWRLHAGGNDSVYLLLEFQSTVDPLMAVRALTYTGLLYQDLIKSDRISHQPLPPILPVVLYRGDRRWNAPTSLRTASSTLVSSPKHLRANVRYQLIDIRRLSLDVPNLKHNLAAAMFRVENSATARELHERVLSLLSMLKGLAAESLRRAFSVWLRSVEVARAKEGWSRNAMNFEEMHMLSDRIAEWEAGWKAEGKAALLLRLMRARFGRKPPQWVQREVRRATSAQLDRWGVRLLAAKTLRELFPARH